MNIKRVSTFILMILVLITAFSGCGSDIGNLGKVSNPNTLGDSTGTLDKSLLGAEDGIDENSSSEDKALTGETGVLKGRVICIDPGHQSGANKGQEPIAPSSDIRKDKTSSGTSGISTGVPEYKLNMEVSLLLRDLLERYGAKIIMTRTTHDVNLSNIERAKIANDNRADLSVRIHADGAENRSVRGVSVLFPGKQYVKDEQLLASSKSAAQKVLDGIMAETGATSGKLSERNDLTGFNWSTVPVILVEMGFMTNADEDKLMETREYQEKMAKGITAGIIDYFSGLK